jgi:ArsR family transcriptional regulator, arsenate/arsenite/antimonite-responsive transcriptional repressor
LNDTPDRISAIEAQLAILQERLAALEAGPPPSTPPALPQADGSLIEQMRARRGPPYEADQTRGAVTYAGAVELQGAEYIWQVERPVPALLQLETEGIARVITALGSPQRLLLLRALLHGQHSSQQLQAALEVTSAGQLYHHLKELLAAGIIEQRGRNNYRLDPRKIVPFLTLLAAALDLAASAEH